MYGVDIYCVSKMPWNEGIRTESTSPGSCTKMLNYNSLKNSQGIDRTVNTDSHTVKNVKSAHLVSVQLFW
jgi:hypothetical protein